MSNLNNNGWDILPNTIGLKRSIENLNTLKNNIFNELSAEIKNSENNTNQREVVKGIIRSILRFSSEAEDLRKILVKEIEGKCTFINKFYYIGLPYFLLHFPNDALEEGATHSDFTPSEGSGVTLWTALNDYELEYSPITIYERSHKFINFFIYLILNISGYSSKRLFNKNKQLEKNLAPLMQRTYYWNTKLSHKGNLNITNKVHVAVVFRITKRHLKSEPSDILSDLKLQKTSKSSTNSAMSKNLFNILSEIYNYINNIKVDNQSEINHFINLLNKISINLTKIESRSISFSLYMIGQRLNGDKYISNLMHLSSLYYSTENSLSLEKLDKTDIYKKFLENNNFKNKLEIMV